jgi:hypothetical protein
MFDFAVKLLLLVSELIQRSRCLVQLRADSADVAHVQTAGCGTVQTLPAGEHHIDRVCNVPQRCGHLVIQLYSCCNTRHEITSYS